MPTATLARTVLVVPCYNEARRLDRTAWLDLAGDDTSIGLLFVDDGSGDETRAVLESLRRDAPTRIEVLGLPHNVGKAEAVRQGMLTALAGGAGVVGYTDADLATPVAELRRLVQVLAAHPEVEALIAARVALAGRRIGRHPSRHYLGRVFSTFASLSLQKAIYDTQCGAKLFRAGELLEVSLSEPFRSRWSFDVELIGRLLIGTPGLAGLGEHELIEEPLRRWEDVSGSKLRKRDMLRAAFDLAGIAVDLQRRRARVANG